MKPRFCFLLIATLALLFTAPVFAQNVQVVQDDDWCRKSRWESDNDRERHCEVREVTLAANRDVIRVDGRKNGGISVQGWDRNEILVRAKVSAYARTEAAARDLADDVRLRTDGSEIYADVPNTGRKEGMSVSFEVFVPHHSNLALKAHNGGIDIADVDGDIAFDALNGGVSLSNLSGNVTGETTNGGLEIELSGSEWAGRGMDVETTNGGVEIKVPDDYSARLETGTVNGKVYVDFPVTVQGRLDRTFETELGRGGKTIRVRTTNGGVEIRKI
jgi:DUF4097 and DUF4098 domain-containing protein YvlB